MRKSTLMMLCLLVLGSTAFAMDLAIGAGGLFGYTREQYEIYDDGEFWYRNDNDAFVYGGYAFFGLSRYMEANISVYAGTNSATYTYWNEEKEEDEYQGSQVGIGLYLKRPFTLSDRFVFFPAIGVDVQNNVGGLDLWVRGGLGLDIFFTEKVFLRFQALYGYDFLLIYKGALNENTEALPTHGPVAKLGLGWMY